MASLCSENRTRLRASGCFIHQKLPRRADSLIACRWISDLPSSFESSNLELVDSFRLPPIDDLRKASTDNYMVGLEEIGAIATDKSTALLGSHKEFRVLLANAVQEAQQGVSLGIDMVVAVGRKPTS